MRVSAESNGRKVSTKDVWAKEPGTLPLPIREIDTMESIVMGFRMDMLDITDNKGNGGSISTCAGFGGEGILLNWKDGKKERQAVVRGSDLLIAWVETFDPKGAEAMREARP